METERSLMRSWVSDSAIVIALIAVAASFLSFIHEAGFFTFFHLPVELISLTSINIWIMSVPFFYDVAYIVLTVFIPDFIGRAKLKLYGNIY